MRPRLPRRTSACLAAATALLLPVATAQASPTAGSTTAVAPPPGPSGPDLSTRAGALADEALQRWASRQRDDGHFPDPIYGNGGDYGTAMLGYAMLRRGAQQGDRALIRGGLDALLAQARTPAGGAFELLALARAYRWANGALPDHPVAGSLWRAAAPTLAADLSARGPVGIATKSARCFQDTSCYNNLKLVSSLATLELQSTGLPPSGPGSLLADPATSVALLDQIGVRIPKETGGGVQRTGQSPMVGGGLLSDPPRNPLAYHALSTTMLGGVLDELGANAPQSARDAFDRAARGLLLFAAPDGDVTYYGRGQGQVWVPAVVADAAAQAAERTVDPILRGQYLALAETSLARLRGMYGVGVAGFPLVPGAASVGILLERRVDPYATTRSYNGLAIDSLDRAAATLKRVDGTATVLPSATGGVVRSPRQAAIATVTRGGLWMGLAAKSRARDDARYGSGLLALQRRDAAGRWSSVMPGRPYTPRVVNTLSVKVRGTTYVASGDVGPAGPATVAIKGGWTRPGIATSMLDYGTTFRWTLRDERTVDVRFRVKSTREVALNGLIGDGGIMRKVPYGFVVTAADGSALQYSLGVLERRLPLQRSQLPGGGSAYDAEVGLAQARALVRKGEHVVVKIRVIAEAPVPVSGG